MILLVRIAWRNLWRHRRRTLITAVAMAVGMALVMASNTLQAGVYGELFRVMVEQRLGHVQVHHPEYPAGRSLHDTLKGAGALLATVDATPGTIGAAPRVFGYALVGTETRSVGALLVGVDPEREAKVGTIAARVPQGRFIGPTPAGECTIGHDLSEELDIGVGATVVAVTQAADGSLGNALYQVVGVHKTGDAQVDRSGVYLHLADVQELLALPDQVHGVTIVTDDAEQLDPYADRLRTALGGDPSAIEVQTWSQASPESAQMLAMSDIAAVVSLTIVFGAAAFGVLNTMMMSVFERTRELGVLVALGLRPWRMVTMILAESVLLAGLAGAIGLGLGGALCGYMVTYGIDFSSGAEEGLSFSGVMIDPVVKGVVQPGGIVQVVVAVIVVSVGASLWPALRAARLRPVEAMRAE